MYTNIIQQIIVAESNTRHYILQYIPDIKKREGLAKHTSSGRSLKRSTDVYNHATNGLRV